MFRLSPAQNEALQAILDEPLAVEMCRHFAEAAAAEGIDPDTLRARVDAGLRIATRLDAADGFELSTVVFLAVFFDPAFSDRPAVKELLDQRRLPLAARLRLLLRAVTRSAA